MASNVPLTPSGINFPGVTGLTGTPLTTVGLGTTPTLTTSLPSIPCVGGIDASILWTGGSTVNRSTEPVDILCYRPVEFSSKQKQMIALKEGLDEARRLELPNDSNKTISLISLIQEIKLLVETRGFDTVFRLVSPDSLSETYLLEKWGEITEDQVEHMVDGFTWLFSLVVTL